LKIVFTHLSTAATIKHRIQQLTTSSNTNHKKKEESNISNKQQEEASCEETMMGTRASPAPLDSSSFEKALESNRKLQASIRRELEVSASLKAENREKASRTTQQLASILVVHQSSPEEQLPRKLQCNPYRETTDRFFVDKKGSQPEPNPDTLRRRSIEQTTFLCHLQPPWSDKEAKKLAAIVEKHLESTSRDKSGDEDDGINSNKGLDNVDFEQVAVQLRDGSNRKGASIVARTAEECRIQHERINHKPSPMTKEESLYIVEMVHDAKQKNESPNWKDIAASLKKRTAWDCLVAYQTKIEPIQPEPWTLEEDELLLTYVSAGGPQFVLDKNTVQRIISDVLPHKTRNQIFTRINQTLLNPKLKHDAWTHDEERRLAILMKMYRDTPDDIYRASTHFDRAASMVLTKWNRTLNPGACVRALRERIKRSPHTHNLKNQISFIPSAYSTLPFTSQEDKEILDAVRGNYAVPLQELSETLFPNRHPYRLYHRFIELASDQDILQRDADTLDKRKTTGTLTSDDYVEQVVAKRTRRL
jgi:hypothetical protein